ncbi:MAG: hypothetical protein WCE94_04560 [Candidatus Methanoperedens sp.]
MTNQFHTIPKQMIIIFIAAVIVLSAVIGYGLFTANQQCSPCNIQSGAVNPAVSYIQLVNASRVINQTGTWQWTIKNCDDKDHVVAPISYFYNTGNVVIGAAIGKTIGDPCSTCVLTAKTVIYNGTAWATVPAHSQITVYCDNTTCANAATAVVNVKVYNIDSKASDLLYPKWDAYVQLIGQFTQSGNDLRIALAGDPSSFTDAALAWAKANGVTEIHIVPYTLDTFPDVHARIDKYNLFAVYDIEGPLWALRGFSSTPFTDTEMAQLKAIKDTGWDAFASEGLVRVQVQQLNSLGLPFISYGSEIGTILYEGQPNIYQHPLGSHLADYQEVYDVTLKQAYFDSIKYSATVAKAHGQGFTTGLWLNGGAVYGQANPAVINGEIIRWVNELYKTYNIKLGTVMFWTGMGQSPMPWVQPGGAFHDLFVQIQTFRYN